MTKKLRVKIKQKSGRKNIKIRYLVVAFAVALLAAPKMTTGTVQAAGCPDLRVVFARGSGGELNVDKNFQAFKSAIETKLATTSLSYDFIDLDYPAVGVGIDNLMVTLGALFGAGESYTFGRSVANGAQKLINMVNGGTCPRTKYVIGGYSQGAIVVSKSLPKLNASRIIYAATFGDPKLYLPEGEGLFPAACRGQNLSDYRMYVPDCQTYQGLLGGYIPYEPMAYAGKLGTWCNKHDFFCSPFRNMSKHTAYVSDSLYEDASRVIFDKVNQHFELNSRVASPHDTVILIDSTGSMGALINKYKDEALRLARETLDSGGRVALYDYRDLNDPYQPVEHCNFETCTLEKFQQGLAKIVASGGGDAPESLLSAAYHAMKKLSWKYGATKSLVVLTDAGFLSPDRDGISAQKVVELSRSIDPVNFYIITEPSQAGSYLDLAEQTGGKVVSDLDTLHLLTDYIMDRYDSLARVEESDPVSRPTLTVETVERLTDDSVRIKFATDGTETMIALNDAILGTTKDNEIVINQLDPSLENNLILVPMNDTMRGDGVVVKLNDGADLLEQMLAGATKIPVQPVTLKAPDTGKGKE